MKHFAAPSLRWNEIADETKLSIVKLAIRDGKTCVDIAKDYGATKGQVVGFANRRGLFFGVRRAADDAILGAENAVKVKRLPGRKSSETFKNIEFWQANVTKDCAAERLGMSKAMAAFEPISGQKLVSLADLKDNQCRWPFDTDEGSRFCGAGCAPGQSYCETHRQKAYRRVAW